MCAARLLNAFHRTAAGAAAMTAIALFAASPAQAGEVITRNCLHGSGGTNNFDYRNEYSQQYGNDYGNSYGSAYSYTRPDRFNRGFGFHRGPVTNFANPNGGGTFSGADSGSSSGYNSGSSHGSGVGSSSAYGDGSCVEIRRELTNPYVIQVPQPQTEKDIADASARERLWTARCRPAIRQDPYGVRRYHYAAPGCEYGKYE